LIGHRQAVTADDIGAELIQRAGYRPESTFKATAAASLAGKCRKGDVLTWLARGTRHLGKTVGFYELTPNGFAPGGGGGGRKVAALVEGCNARPHGWAWGGRAALVGMDEMEEAVTYLPDTEGTFAVHMPERP
jgi:hypothetical protein